MQVACISDIASEGRRAADVLEELSREVFGLFAKGDDVITTLELEEEAGARNPRPATPHSVKKGEEEEKAIETAMGLAHAVAPEPTAMGPSPPRTAIPCGRNPNPNPNLTPNPRPENLLCSGLN
jgi:hypothetical protein